MNHFTRRCGCGAIFALVHLRDRSVRCNACQRRRSMVFARTKADLARQQTAQDFIRLVLQRIRDPESQAFVLAAFERRLGELARGEA